MSITCINPNNNTNVASKICAESTTTHPSVSSDQRRDEAPSNTGKVRFALN